jgi:hypothetical protein
MPLCHPLTRALQLAKLKDMAQAIFEVCRALPRCLAALGTAQGAAKAHGCRLELLWRDKPYASMATNTAMMERYRAHGAAWGFKLPKKEDDEHMLLGV